MAKRKSPEEHKLFAFNEAAEVPKPAVDKTASVRTFLRSPAIIKEQFKGAESVRQGGLWDQLEQETQENITAIGLSREWIIEKGTNYNFEPAEHKLLMCISLLLYKKSQNADKTKPDFFIGNANPDKEAPMKGGKSRLINSSGKTASLILTLYELTKEYKGGGKTTGKDVANVSKLLNELANNVRKKVWMESPIININSKGKEEKLWRGGFKSLFTIEYLFKKPDVIGEKNKVKSVLIVLHPIWRNAVDQRWIPFPIDIITRLEEAYGHADVSGPTWRLFEWLSDQHSMMKKSRNPDFKTEINLFETSIKGAGLFWLLAPKYMKAKKHKDVYDLFSKAVDACIKVGVLASCTIKKGVTGQNKACFVLNKEWLKPA